MSKTPQTAEIPDRIPSDLAESLVEKHVGRMIRDEEFRNKVKEIVNAELETVPLMKKIKAYASEEIDSRIYKSMGFWFKTVAIPIVVTIATYLILIYVLKIHP
ncbi:MAG TPA: hypothetical protein VG917_03175 [Patescibacteria group bacterium]|nr:hypothetical protein [Patescibacteria group bacterium]